MTRERFPHKEPGDHLSADHVNRLGDVCERVADPNYSETNLSPNRQYVFQIANTQAFAGDTHTSGLYLGRRRWYSHNYSAWQIDGIDYLIDGSDLGVLLTVGARLACFWDAQRQAFVPCSSPSSNTQTVRFELTENLTFGSHATAKLLVWSAAEDDYEANDDLQAEVYDAFDKFNQNCRPYGQAGARGYAEYRFDRTVWEITQMEHQARWIEFVVNEGSGFADTDATVAVNGVTYHDGYRPEDDVVLVYNKTANATPYIFEGDDDDEGIALYDPATDKYTIVQVECP